MLEGAKSTSPTSSVADGLSEIIRLHTPDRLSRKVGAPEQLAVSSTAVALKYRFDVV
jgi:hypothetical protein